MRLVPTIVTPRKIIANRRYLKTQRDPVFDIPQNLPFGDYRVYADLHELYENGATPFSTNGLLHIVDVVIEEDARALQCERTNHISVAFDMAQSSGPANWKIEPVLPGGARLHASTSANGATALQGATNLWISAGNIATNYTLTATHPKVTNILDTAEIWVIDIDLDIDSDNSNGYGLPDRSEAEELIESHPVNSIYPGKALFLNELDLDMDGVPDFADGYDIDFGNGSQSADNASRAFVPVVLQFSSLPDTAVVRFRCDALASPANVSRTGDGTHADPWRYALGDAGKIRVWAKDGIRARRKAAFPTGDAIENNTMIPHASFPHNPANTHVFYIEAVGGSALRADIALHADIFPFGASKPGLSFTDTVKMTVFHIETLHPVTADFAPGQAGKVMISTRHDADKTTAYHTDAIPKAESLASLTRGNALRHGVLAPQWGRSFHTTPFFLSFSFPGWDFLVHLLYIQLLLSLFISQPRRG